MPTLFLGFDHLPKGKLQGAYQTNFGLGFDKFPLSIQPTNSSNFHIIDTEGWLAFSDIANAIRSIGYKLGDLITRTGARRFGMGMRVKIPTPVPATNTLMALATTVGNTGSPVIFAISDLPGIAAGKEYYLECEFDDDGSSTNSMTIRRRIDGQEITPLTTTNSTHISLIRTGNMYLYWSCYAGTGANRIRMKDFYFNEADYNSTSFLGPIRLVPLTIDTVDGTGFSAVGAADLKAAVTTPLPESGDMFATYVQSGITDAPLNINFGTSLSNDEKILAVKTTWGARSSDGTSVSINAKLKNGAAEIDLGNFTVNAAGSFGIHLPQPLQAPGGVPWTVALLNSTDLILTPVIGG